MITKNNILYPTSNSVIQITYAKESIDLTALAAYPIDIQLEPTKRLLITNLYIQITGYAGSLATQSTIRIGNNGTFNNILPDYEISNQTVDTITVVTMSNVLPVIDMSTFQLSVIVTRAATGVTTHNCTILLSGIWI